MMPGPAELDPLSDPPAVLAPPEVAGLAVAAAAAAAAAAFEYPAITCGMYASSSGRWNWAERADARVWRTGGAVAPPEGTTGTSPRE